LNISIFGLGYVGCVTAACLAHDGHDVIGVDVNSNKVDLLNHGKSPLVEPGLEERITASVASGKLRACMDVDDAVQATDISLICVGTPSNENGSLDLKYVKKVCQQIGTALLHKKKYHVVVVRSTVLPGTVEDLLIPIIEEASGLKAGKDFGVCMNPEFLREGVAIQDYYMPSFIVIGEIDVQSGKLAENIYTNVKAPVFHTAIKNAEMVKYACNSFHALKITFANEIGQICKAHGMDGQEVMDIFVQDKQLNVSPAYLRPGFAFGGSCLPKDVRALTYRAKQVDAECNVLNAILPSNQKQIAITVRMVERIGLKKVGILGLSFKPNTDDLRESPSIVLTETLIGRGYQVRIFDDQVQLSQIIGANKAFIEKELPHIASIMCDSLEDVLDFSEVVVLTHGGKVFAGIAELLDETQTLIDLVGVTKNDPLLKASYNGIAW
jgi:GDP-mannose 6-dehydrogenase